MKKDMANTFLNWGLMLLVASSQTFGLSCAVAAEQAPLVQNTPLHLSVLSSASANDLTPGAIEAAKLLGIFPKVERLRQIASSRHDGQPISDEELGLKVDVLDRIMGGSLEVRMVSGRIDREIAWAFSNQGSLIAKRQKTLNYIFTANFLQGGVLGTLSGPAFLHGEPKTGTTLLLLASSIGLGLSLAAFAEARTGSRKMDTETTVLADVFKLSPPESSHRMVTIRNFLNSVPPDSKDNKSRIDILIDGWRKGHYLNSMDETTLRKLSGFQPDGVHFSENIKLLASRIRLLFDTQYTIEQLDSELVELLCATDMQ